MSRHPKREEILAWCLAVLLISATAFLAWLAMQGDPPEPRGDVRSPGALPSDYRRIEPERLPPPCDALTVGAMLPCVREKLPCR